MSTSTEMMAAGTPAGQAKAINGAVGTLTATGSGASDAALIKSSVTTVNSGSGAGVILPSATPGDEFVIGNATGGNVTLYPPTGGTVNGGASETLGNTTAAIAKATGALTYIVVLGA